MCPCGLQKKSVVITDGTGDILQIVNWLFACEYLWYIVLHYVEPRILENRKHWWLWWLYMVVIFRKANKRDPVGLLWAYVPQMSIAPHPIKIGFDTELTSPKFLVEYILRYCSSIKARLPGNQGGLIDTGTSTNTTLWQGSFFVTVPDDYSLKVVMLSMVSTMIPSMFVVAPICFRTMSQSLLPPT